MSAFNLYFKQFKAVMWKNWMIKNANKFSTAAEILIPVVFMMLLIWIKTLTEVYDSPNIAYHCGNTYPWYYSSSLLQSSVYPYQPFQCTQKPSDCTLKNYYPTKYEVEYIPSVQPPNDSYIFEGYSQLGYVPTAVTDGAAESPLYSATIADKSTLYSDLQITNPSLPFTSMVKRLYHFNVKLGIASKYSDNLEVTNQINNLISYLEGISGYDQSAFILSFDSEKSLNNYITNRDYDDANYGSGKIAYAIVLNNVDFNNANWDYSIRTNFTFFNDESTVACLSGQDFVNVKSYSHKKNCDFTYSIPSTKFVSQDLYKPQTVAFINGYLYSGFSTLQQTVDQFIMDSYPLSSNANINANLKLENDIDRNDNSVGANVTHSSLESGLKAYSAPLTNIIASVSPMPTPAYLTDSFQYVISSTLGIFYMLSFLYPVSRILRSLVIEKETRIKEGMKMMGLFDFIYDMSWFVTLFIQMTIVSLLITLVTARTVFQYSSKLYVFIFFESFSLAIIGLCFFLSTLFSRAKVASFIGPMIFFGSFFPYYAVNDAQFSVKSKILTCFSAPACFALGGNVFADFEGGLVGVHSYNVNQLTSNFSFVYCIIMLLVDFVLYSLIAWYLDKVLPTEFGTPLPFYFIIMPTYWFPNSFANTYNVSSSDSLKNPLVDNGQYEQIPDIENELNSTSDFSSYPIIPVEADKYNESTSNDLTSQLKDMKCISIRGLRKVFKTLDSDKVAVDNVNVDIFEGQITVFLGTVCFVTRIYTISLMHRISVGNNGAGKQVMCQL